MIGIFIAQNANVISHNVILEYNEPFSDARVNTAFMDAVSSSRF
jgi:hypothetical protein